MTDPRDLIVTVGGVEVIGGYFPNAPIPIGTASMQIDGEWAKVGTAMAKPDGSVVVQIDPAMAEKVLTPEAFGRYLSIGREVTPSAKP